MNEIIKKEQEIELYDFGYLTQDTKKTVRPDYKNAIIQQMSLACAPILDISSNFGRKIKGSGLSGALYRFYTEIDHSGNFHSPGMQATSNIEKAYQQLGYSIPVLELQLNEKSQYLEDQMEEIYEKLKTPEVIEYFKNIPEIRKLKFDAHRGEIQPLINADLRLGREAITQYANALNNFYEAAKATIIAYDGSVEEYDERTLEKTLQDTIESNLMSLKLLN